MDASSLLLVALSSRDVSDDVPPLTARDLWTVIQASDDRQISLSALFGDEDSWRSVLAPGLHEAAAARLALADVADVADGVVSDLRENGIWVSSPFEDSWPHRLRTRLKAHAPVVLYGPGDASLLAVVAGTDNADPVYTPA